jgi:hypothetical protein
VSPATLNEHEDDTIHEHEFVKPVSPAWSFSMASWSGACRRDGYSAVTPVTAALPEDSSMLALLSANAATRD